MACLIYQKTRQGILSKKKTIVVCGLVLKTLRLDADVSLHLVGDRAMIRMNKKYRGIDRTTDVLSFGMEEKDKKKVMDLGDIFISVPRVKRQAKELGIPAKEEFARVWIHGILHLAGYDHLKAKDAKKMFFLQEDIFKKSGDFL